MTDFAKALFSFIFLLILGIALGSPVRTEKFQKTTEDADKNNILGNDPINAVEGRAEAPSNPLGAFQQWLSGSSGGGSMVLGTYQALLMPMPQGQDVVNGVTNVVQGIQGLFQG